MINMRIKKVLTELEKNGYDAYVVGGYVRDYVLGNESYDIDISTSAKPKEIRSIFNLSNSNDDTYGRICFKDSLYNYDITTFRRDVKYVNRKPTYYDFIESKEEDVLRRDFTINGLYMDSSGRIIDLVDGLKDIKEKTICVIGNIDAKLKEDPLRILRAIRFSSNLGFKLDEKLFNYIKQNKQLISTLSYERKKSELDLIFKSKNYKEGLKLLKELNLLDVLEIDYDQVLNCSNYLGIWAQIEYNCNYPFNRMERKIITSIRNILAYSTIDNYSLFQYGLYPSVIAGEILGISKKYISSVYKNMPIYSRKDIKIDGNDIMKILHIQQGMKLKNILLDIELNIINNNLENEYTILKNYILKNWR